MVKKFSEPLLKLLMVLVLLYVFLISIGLMGAAFKGFGKGFAENLLNTTSNPFIGLFVGILATSLVQSSSTVTSILVGMVASGVITVTAAIPIVFGANIGTTVTNSLVAIGHISRREEFKRAIAGATVHDFFNLICVAIFFPIELFSGLLQKTATALADKFVDFGGIKFTSPIQTITKPVIKAIKQFMLDGFPFSDMAVYILLLILSFVLMYLALFLVVKIMKSLIIQKTENVFNEVVGKNGLIGIAAGLVFTVLVQSSSITTSILVPLVASGVITIESAFPITMGANIGTTATALLASFATGEVSAIIIAFVHLLFNVFGVALIYPIGFFRRIPIRLAKELGELAFKKRRYAVIYVLTLFFVLPGILILVSKLIH